MNSAAGDQKQKEDPPQDFVEWLAEAAQGGGRDAEPEAIVMNIFFLIVAAMHSSTVTAIHAVYDLCAHPETMLDLREEVRAVLGAHGRTYAALLRLHRMESFLKESGRQLGRHRLVPASRDVPHSRLSSGFVILAGTHICTTSDARSRDLALYEAPLEFRPLHFYHPPSSEAAGGEVDAAHIFSSVANGDS